MLQVAKMRGLVGVVRWCVGLVLACVVAGCASGGAPVSVPGSDRTLPRAALDALKDQWPAVKLEGDRSAPCGASVPAPLVQGDFNGDALIDTALWLTAGGTTRLAVVLARVDNEYVVVEVGTPEAVAGHHLEVIPKGTLLHTPPGDFDPYAGFDTIALRPCTGPRTAWRWNGTTFQPQALVD
jgi:hypothetical protein